MVEIFVHHLLFRLLTTLVRFIVKLSNYTQFIPVTGNGQIWYPVWNNLKNSRPSLIWFYHCTNVNVSNITLLNSPMFHLMIDHTNYVIIHDINITSPNFSIARNTDGIDIAGDYVHIYDSYISNGDDSYVLKPGANHVLVENCIAANGLGLNIGTGGDPPIQNVTFRNIICDKTWYCTRLKAKSTSQDGMMMNISFINITMNEVQKGININQFNESIHTLNDAEILKYIDMENVTWDGLYGNYTVYGGHLDCSKTMPCKDLVFKNVDIKPLENATNWECENVYGVQENVSPSIECLEKNPVVSF